MQNYINKEHIKEWKHFIFFKFGVLLYIICCAYLSNTYNSTNHELFYNYYETDWPRSIEPNFYSRFTTWDGGLYFHLIHSEYVNNSALCAFYPLLPLLYKPLNFIVSKKILLIVVFLINNVISLAGIILLYEAIKQYKSKHFSKIFVFLTIFYPGFFAHHFIYTESLYFFLYSLCVYSLIFNNKFFLHASLMLLPITRSIGIFAFFIPAVYFYKQKQYRPIFYSLCSTSLGWCMYLLIIYAYTDSFFEGFEAQQFFVNKPSLFNIFLLTSFYNKFISAHYLFHATFGLIDRFALIYVLILCIYSYKCWHWNFFYGMLIICIPALTTQMVSFMRFSSLCVPAFYVLALLLLKSKNNHILNTHFAVYIFCQLYFIYRHLNFYWVS